MGVTNMTLVKIGAIGGVATVTMGLLFKGKIEANIRATVYYKEALKTLRSHRGAVQILGEPIKDRAVDIGNESKNYTKGNTARYEVPVKGPKQKGTLYFWAERDENENKWSVNQIELEIGNDTNRRLVIRSRGSN